MLDQGLRGAQVAVLKAVGHETRLHILQELLEGERNVSSLIDAVGLPQSGVSQHLACLRNCGLVQTRRKGKEVYYRLNGQGRIRKLLEIVRDQVQECLEGVLSCDVVGEKIGKVKAKA